jgi:hypothetical protein
MHREYHEAQETLRPSIDPNLPSLFDPVMAYSVE